MRAFTQRQADVMKIFRIFTGSILVLLGVVFTVLPGSFLFVLGGLVLLSMDFPIARRLLSEVQRTTSRAARRLDLFLLNRKYK